MKTKHIKSNERGHANHGWLNAHHMFSFANYYNPEQMGFGKLRVLNDDVIQGGTGFSEHPHANMEIITVPLSGALKHADNMGNSGVIKSGQVQVMSAGTGLRHAELNASSTEETNISQIWVLPDVENVEPRYDQIDFSMDANTLQQIISPNKDDAGSWIYSNSWFYHGIFNAESSVDYSLHGEDQGAFIFLIEGQLKVGEETIERRDGFGVYDTNSFTIEVQKDSRFLILEVPMGQ